MSTNYTNPLTKIELAVWFFIVDDVEDIWCASLHIAHLKIKPLVMVAGVDVSI